MKLGEFVLNHFQKENALPLIVEEYWDGGTSVLTMDAIYSYGDFVRNHIGGELDPDWEVFDDGGGESIYVTFSDIAPKIDTLGGDLETDYVLDCVSNWIEEASFRVLVVWVTIDRKEEE